MSSDDDKRIKDKRDAGYKGIKPIHKSERWRKRPVHEYLDDPDEDYDDTGIGIQAKINVLL